MKLIEVMWVPPRASHELAEQAQGSGGRRDVLLGTHGSVAAAKKYAAIIAEWEATGCRLPEPGESCTNKTCHRTIVELAVAFSAHVERHYRRADGTPTNEQNDFRLSLRPLVHLYGDDRVTDFTPLKLRAVRELMVKGYTHPKYGPKRCLARGVVNQRVGRIRRMFKWAVENECVPPQILQGLLAVKGLAAGRTEARETDPVQPVSRTVVDATLPYLQPMVADMVRLQLETGMRPGEAGDHAGVRPRHERRRLGVPARTITRPFTAAAGGWSALAHVVSKSSSGICAPDSMLTCSHPSQSAKRWMHSDGGLASHP